MPMATASVGSWKESKFRLGQRVHEASQLNTGSLVIPKSGLSLGLLAHKPVSINAI
jgi:hypothetical protein